MIKPFLAYLDPTAGSMAWQVAISSILAIAAACRLYWWKVKRMLHIGSQEPTDADHTETLGRRT